MVSFCATFRRIAGSFRRVLLGPKRRWQQYAGMRPAALLQVTHVRRESLQNIADEPDATPLMLTVPQKGIRREGSDQKPSNKYVQTTFKSLKCDFSSGSPFSDSPLGNGEMMLTCLLGSRWSPTSCQPIAGPASRFRRGGVTRAPRETRRSGLGGSVRRAAHRLVVLHMKSVCCLFCFVSTRSLLVRME